MEFQTADLCDRFAAELQIGEPLFRDYGGKPRFAGQIATIKCFEDNSRVRDLVEGGSIKYVEAIAHSLITQDGQFRGVRVKKTDGELADIEADYALVFFGLHPKLGPIAEWGLNIDKRAITVDTEKFQTNVPGIFAIGDINTYPGKKKLILSGFHECALAAFAAAPIIFPEKGKIHLQYTTTSPKLHKVLGVETPVFD